MSLRIEKYGVHAVMGRPVLYESEMRRMNVAQTIVSAYKDRAKSASWDAWYTANKELGDLLFKAGQLYNDAP